MTNKVETSIQYRKSRNVLIIRSNPVRPDSRVEKEATALSKAGYNVHILAWDRDSNHSEQINKLNNDSGVLITRIGFKAGFGDGMKKIKQFLGFQFFIRRYIKKHKDEIDYIHACDFDTAFFSYRLAKRLKKTFVFDIFDFVYGNPKNIFQEMIKIAQIDIINKANATIICTEDRENQIKNAKPKKLVVIHNTPPYLEGQAYGIREQYKASVVYVGVLQDYRLLLEIGDYFKKHPEIRFDIAGFGMHEDYFKLLNKECPNIFFHGRIDYSETLKLEQRADIMLAIYDPSLENHRFAAPNKFYEALMLGKPLVMVKDTGMSNVVEKYDIGVLINYSQDGFAEGISRLIQRRDDWDDISKRMKKIYKEQYNWNEMERRLINLYSSLK